MSNCIVRTFTRAEVTYAWSRTDGTVGSDREPVAEFTGEAVHAYLGRLPDADIEAMLNELAAALGAALGQERIYVAFCAPGAPGSWTPRNARRNRFAVAVIWASSAHRPWPRRPRLRQFRHSTPAVARRMWGTRSLGRREDGLGLVSGSQRGGGYHEAIENRSADCACGRRRAGRVCPIGATIRASGCSAV